MSKTFQKGEHVCYGTNGVCLIEDICEMAVAKEKEQFYVLRPLHDRHSTFYIPIRNDELTEKIRNPVTREKIDAMIETVRTDYGEWIVDRKARMEAFRIVLRETDPLEVLRLCVLLSNHKQLLADNGKRLAPSDESVLKQVQDLTDTEFGFALDIPANEVKPYVTKRLKSK